jgi:hypothetical protein
VAGGEKSADPEIPYFPSGMFFQVDYNVSINFRAGLGDSLASARPPGNETESREASAERKAFSDGKKRHP